MSKIKNVGLIGLNKVNNLGDPILFENTKFLINKSDENIDVTEIYLFGYQNNILIDIISKFLTLIIIILELVTIDDGLIYTSILKARTNLTYKKYYKKKFRNINALIFSGGGLIKIGRENLDVCIISAIEVAEKFNIPIYFNAVGVERYKIDGYRFKKLKRALNSVNIKHISTRDDIEFLKEEIIYNKNIKISQVADSAFWSDEAYFDYIKTNKITNEKELIGLNIARHEIFKDYGFVFPKYKQLDFWVELYEGIKEQDLDVILYTNGNYDDNEFLYEIADGLKDRNKDVKIFIPNNHYDLIRFTSNLSKIIATRMHASIIAYSLNVPSLGVIWNDKIAFFAEMIGYEGRYYRPNELNVNKILKVLNKIEYNSSDQQLKEELRFKTYKELKHFLDTYC